MKKILFIIMLFFAQLAAGDPSGREALTEILDIMNPESSQGIMKQTIVTSSGKIRVLEYETYMGEKGKYSLMRYKSPARVKGNALLMTDFSDNIWMYNKRTNRVRKLASHAKKQKFEGSDFTYEDMGSGDTWLENYTPSIKGSKKIDGILCYQLELKANNDDNSYSKMIIWSRVSDFFPIQIDYYDENMIFSKSLYLKNIKTIEGIPTAMEMLMKNHLDMTESKIENISVTYDVNFNKAYFSERNLKK